MNSRLMKHQYAHTIPLERQGRCSLLRHRVYTLQSSGPGFQARRVGRPVTNVTAGTRFQNSPSSEKLISSGVTSGKAML